MKNVSIRLEDELYTMLSEISTKPTKAGQATVEVMLWLRRTTIHELKGRFTRAEIITLANNFKGLTPAWKIQCNPSVFITQTEDAEKYQNSTSSNGANPDELINKLKSLTSAQVAILQLELWAFWNHDESTEPDLEVLIKYLS